MHISYLAVSEKRCTIQMTNCNFKCRGCFSNKRHDQCIDITPSRLAKHIPSDKEVMLAGGEPTIDKQGLLSLIHELDRQKLIISTNGYLLDETLLQKLKGITIHIDLKALNTKLHRWYTGKDNTRILKAVQLLYSNDFDFTVSTVYIPDVVDIEEIERIARFLSGIGDIRYKIIRYIPVGGLSRRPHIREIETSVTIAKKYLSNVSSSMENRSHPKYRKILDPLVLLE